MAVKKVENQEILKGNTTFQEEQLDILAHMEGLLSQIRNWLMFFGIITILGIIIAVMNAVYFVRLF